MALSVVALGWAAAFAGRPLVPAAAAYGWSEPAQVALCSAVALTGHPVLAPVTLDRSLAFETVAFAVLTFEAVAFVCSVAFVVAVFAVAVAFVAAAAIFEGRFVTA